MKHLLLSYCLFIVCACSDTYKKSWQDELRATPEYAEILQLRSAMFAEDPLTKPNSKLDKYIEKLSDQEESAFFETWRSESERIQKEAERLAKPTDPSNPEEVAKIAVDYLAQLISKSKMPDILKTTLIESAEQNTKKMVMITALQTKLKIKFPQLQKDPEAISRLLQLETN